MKTKRHETIYETTLFFLENQRPVHITLKSGRWLNGIVKFVEIDRLVLLEEKYGEMILFFERIKQDGIVPKEDKK